MVRLLIVDDIAQVRQGLRIVLPLAAEAAGLQIEIVGEAADGSAAIRQAKLLCPDAILMDLEMPGLDGCAAARAIRHSYPGIRLVALTVHSSDQIRAEAFSAGFDAFFEKGAPADQLVEGITSESPQPPL
jgi:DNA-binding NarL/FixJ family response regulator